MNHFTRLKGGDSIFFALHGRLKGDDAHIDIGHFFPDACRFLWAFHLRQPFGCPLLVLPFAVYLLPDGGDDLPAGCDGFLPRLLFKCQRVLHLFVTCRAFFGFFCQLAVLFLFAALFLRFLLSCHVGADAGSHGFFKILNGINGHHTVFVEGILAPSVLGRPFNGHFEEEATSHDACSVVVAGRLVGFLVGNQAGVVHICIGHTGIFAQPEIVESEF